MILKSELRILKLGAVAIGRKLDIPSWCRAAGPDDVNPGESEFARQAGLNLSEVTRDVDFNEEHPASRGRVTAGLSLSWSCFASKEFSAAESASGA